MTTKKITFDNLTEYLYNLGLKRSIDYCIDIDNKILELNINRHYCISVCDDGKNVEIFRTNVGAKFNELGIYTTDGELHSYKTFKNIACAIKYALKIKSSGIFPDPEKIW